MVFALWIQLDAPWMTIGTAGAPSCRSTPTALDWPLVVVRWIGAALLVPVMEELFWRSFLMRWIEQPAFEGVDPRRVGVKAVVLSTFVFTLAHTLWLAAAVAGLVYALLYVRTGKLWVPVIAHAVTNGVLGVWVRRDGALAVLVSAAQRFRPAEAQPFRPRRSYSEITWAPSSSSVAAISRLSSTTIAVVSEP